ncbi:response regulator transcription factor [Ruegeria arenilitoris]|uniref:response regulator transcription factor n=1 Tax=Ruegeria arenilitoris TaxID=1173585 RepID=UPI001480FF79|nr:response regulator transcription factor [Ruegeria arenilitoris]
MAERILLIDDDARLAEMVGEYLQGFGYSVSVIGNGVEGLEALRDGQFDALILDLSLPDIDGLEVFRNIPASAALPVIMLTARGDPMDRILGLELGADDYLAKPFEPRELLARLKSIIRRGSRNQPTQVMTFGRLGIDLDAMEARIDGQRCDLTSYQFQLLSALATRAGRVLSRDHLMNYLQGTDLDAFDRSIDVHVSRIRAAIEDDPKHPKRLITIRGAGYLFAKSQD